jgi:wyosine [tRNA(Phe)-imidazoG37] synthetase (radical SAM superfamily)
MKKHIYGPVPSRRLGFSLGVDLVPYKVCSYDCIYCQLGRTTDKTVERKEYIAKDEILSQVEETISLDKKIDYITISGSGEPTLNSAMGEIIREIKKMSEIPIAVITNGSLLWDKEVRRELLLADLLLPSLDAADPETFGMINCPHHSLDFHKIVKGLTDLRREFKGIIWLELMLIKGINDNPGEIDLFKSIVSGAGFDRIQLNTVIRPPSQESASPLSAVRLEEIRDVFGRNCENIPDFKSVQKQNITSEDVEAQILEMIERRPVTLSDISTSSGIHRNEVIKYLSILEMKDKIKAYDHEDSHYYERV